MFRRTKKSSIAGKTAKIESSIITLLSVLVPLTKAKTAGTIVNDRVKVKLGSLVITTQRRCRYDR